MLRGSGNPDKVVAMFAKKNPQFAQFMAENRGLTMEQVMRKYGVDPSMLRGIL